MSLRSRHGFTLIELMIALAIGSVLLAAVTHTFINQRKVYTGQEQIGMMQQNVMAGLDFMRRDIMLAGYDPSEAAGAGIVTATATSLEFNMDLNGDGAITPAEEEDVTYVLFDDGEDGDLDLGRTIDGVTQLVAENIQSLDLTYMLGDGTETATPTAAELAQIRMIVVALTARTAKPDLQHNSNSGYRTMQLTLAIQLRNLGA